MSLARVSSFVVRRSFTPAVATRTLHSSAARSNGDDFKKKESTHEKEYADRQEREALRSMLSRMERNADPNDTKAKAALNTLLNKHGINKPQLVTDLINWKHGPSH